MTNILNDPTQTAHPKPPFEQINRERRRGAWILTISATVLGVLLVMAGLAWASTSPSNATEGELSTYASVVETSLASETVVGLVDVSDVAAATVDSVVVVDVVIDTRGPFDSTGSGSGVIVSDEGLIVTNAHVVEDATEISVELTDGSVYEATLVAEDTAADIAIIEIEADGLDAIVLGSTESLEVGDPVIAIGNPLALDGGPSVSTGIISALDRSIGDADSSLAGVIQTDAAITEGSSGGALLDETGELVGITTAVGVSSVGIEGIGFAIPVETVIDALAGVGFATAA